MAIPISYILCVLIWGSTWYAIELQLGQVPTEWSIAYRFGIAALMMFTWCIVKKKQLRFNRADHMRMAALGGLLFSGNYMFVYIGTGYLTSGLVAIVFSLLTFLNIFNARIWLKIPMQSQALLGALFGLVGLAMIFSKEITSLSLEDATTLGIMITFCGTFIASLGNTIAASDAMRRLPLTSLNAWAMLYGSAIMAGVALIKGVPMVFDDRMSYWLSLSYLSLVGTVVAFNLYLWLIAQIGVAKAAYTAVLIPMVALVISTLLEGFEWSIVALAGVGLIVIGNLIMTRKKPASKRAEESEVLGL